MKMRLRMSDESSWAQEFDASSPAELAAGMRAAWVERVRLNVAKRLGVDVALVASPERLLEARLQQVDAWLAERAARPEATEAARRSWADQAAHWRFQATEQFGGRRMLALHVLCPASGHWCNPDNNVMGYFFAAAPLSPAGAERMWDGCLRMIEHDQNLCGLAKWVGSEVEQTARDLRVRELHEEMERRGLRVVTSSEPTPER